MITELHNQVEVSVFFDSVFKDRLRQEWIPATDLFIERWGKDLVPCDLQVAIRDVCSNTQSTTLEWLVILLVNNDGSLADPAGMDHLGHVGIGS